ncbi:hypothetical protein QJU43_04325 [Pasteurella atlantica]|uniref:Lipoprotein n=1 Tax=Phocoenobacter skyensis TaxID=97481 RepID=A0AAJ6NA02_9PAST|nr:MULTISPECIES: hypothetical protein [Pasteurella]MDP8033649.1 hypothetical protein [Pasteurella atlantica]MDP8035571.1 hypothetical protein [Pasteurella atlantica]MDP8037522.1 hypothetical protein [Pasteurella atlantica]MDP8047871.1 hypothetical protein [Pasteurella atlantica]MDP8049826.1 hypothetical protein [Pasteurella atlantica]
MASYKKIKIALRYIAYIVICCIVFSVILIACVTYTPISTKNKYHNIQKIGVYSLFSNGDYCWSEDCSFIIEDEQKIKRIVDEINSLSTGKWKKIFGKEGLSIIHITLSDNNNNDFELGLYENFLIQKGDGYRQLGTKGWGRKFDMNNTPELKETFNHFNSNNTLTE